MICTQKKAHRKSVGEENGTECRCTRHKHIDAEMKSHLKIFKEDIHRVLLHIEPSVSRQTTEEKKTYIGKNMEIKRRKKNLLRASQWMLMRKYVDVARKV